jgi:hypothetical protein
MMTRILQSGHSCLFLQTRRAAAAPQAASACTNNTSPAAGRHRRASGGVAPQFSARHAAATLNFANFACVATSPVGKRASAASRAATAPAKRARVRRSQCVQQMVCSARQP